MSQTELRSFLYNDFSAPLKFSEGEIHAIFQYEKLPPFTVDGLRYLERESEYFISLGPYVSWRHFCVLFSLMSLPLRCDKELCIQETKFGFVPNSGETHASRVRRKIRFSKGGVSTVMLVHYSRGPAQRESVNRLPDRLRGPVG